MEQNNGTLELRVTDESLLKEITFNYDELKNGLSDKLQKYNELVVTEDAITSAKQDRANLNKLELALAGKGSEIQQRLLGGFDVKLKELRSMVKSTSNKIDVQVKGWEQKVKDAKKEKIKEIYQSFIGDLSTLVSFESIFNDKMLNVTATIPKITAEIQGKIETIRKDIAVIDTLNVDQEIQISVKDYYLKTFDLSGALVEKTRLEQRKADLLARQNAQASKVESAPELPIITPVVEGRITEEVMNAPEIKQIDFRVWVTEEQSKILQGFLINNKIRYGKII